MKKLYRKGTVHPSPPPLPPPIISDDYLSFLPAAIFALAAALSPEDREVLAYLLLCSGSNSSSSSSSSASASASASAAAQPKRPSSASGSGDHAPQFDCDCFRCYTTYWVRWGSSPNRQLIHDIIEAFEDHQHHHHDLQSKSKTKSGKKERRNKHRGNTNTDLKRPQLASSATVDESPEDSETAVPTDGGVEGGEGREVEEEASPEKGSNVRRLVSFIGERIWGVWG